MEKGMLHCVEFLLSLVTVLATAGLATAQMPDNKPPQSEQALLKAEQLDALVAPIALYPDALNNNLRAGAADRMDYRGRDGQKVLDAGMWSNAR